MTAAEFNRRYPVGTPVRYYPNKARPHEFVLTRTRGEAWTLSGGTAIVPLAGMSGGKALDHVVPGAEDSGCGSAPSGTLAP